MKTTLAALLLLTAGCSSIDSTLAKHAIPVEMAQDVAARIAAALPLADLDHDGRVPTTLAELIALVKAITEPAGPMPPVAPR